MKFQGFIGSSYKIDALGVDRQRCVNLYPEIIESQTGKEAQVAYLRCTPGLLKLYETGPGPIRLIHYEDVSRAGDEMIGRPLVFVVSGNKVYRYFYDLIDGWISKDLGYLQTSLGPVTAASVANPQPSGTVYATVFVDGVENYLYQGFSNVGLESFAPFAGYGLPSVPGATHVVWIDGYLIMNQKDTNQFFVSNWQGIVFDPLSFASAEGSPDNIVALIDNYRDLWLFNERTTEIFSNTGNADFPFERVQGGFIEVGCVAPYSVAKIGGYITWLGRDKFGQGIVYSARGFNAERISTHAIEAAIQSYADISSARAYTYQDGGHSFYVISFAEMTWCYDFSTGMWHERAYTSKGELGRHRADCHAFFPQTGIHLVGDYETGKVYQLKNNVFTDDGDAITRKRVTPHVSAGGKYLFYDSFWVDMRTGVGLDGVGQGTNPQAMLRFSDDGGYSFSREKWTSMGRIGNRLARTRWNRLGRSRDRVFDLTITDPVDVVLIDAQLEITQGAS